MTIELLAGRYELLDRVGKGSQGEVYRAKDHWDYHDVAIKLLEDEMPKDEVMVWADLRHPNIVQVLDAGYHNGSPYLALEYVEGPSLREAYMTGGEKALLPLISDICCALETAHARDICHGDLKPTNILIRQELDGPLRAKVADFGLCRRFADDSRSFAGTIAYAAPEVLKGEKRDHRADLYSLGACLYEVVTGKPVFAYDDYHDLIRAHMEEYPVDPRTLNHPVSDQLASLILLLLAKHPQVRPSSAGQVIERIGYQDDSPILGEPTWIGRKREQDFIERLLTLAGEGKGCLTFVIGKEAIGKTMLLNRMYMWWGLEGGIRLRIDCSNKGHISVTDEIINRASRMAGQSPGSAQDQEITVLAKRFVETLRDTGHGKPILMVLNDVGSAEPSFLQFLSVLALMIPDERVSILGDVDRNDKATVEQAIHRFHHLPQVRKPRLRSFTKDEIGKQINSVLHRETEDAFLTQFVYRLSDGIPGHAMEIARYLADRGHIRRAHGGWILNRLPETRELEHSLGSLLLARVGNLPKEQRLVMGALALADQRIPEDALMKITGLNRPRIRETLRGLEEAHLVARQGKRWSLKTGALARAVESALDEAETESLNRALSGTIKELWPSDLNWRIPLVRCLCACGRKDQAFRMAHEGAKQAFENGKFGTALSLFDFAEKCEIDAGPEMKKKIWEGKAICHRELHHPRQTIEQLRKIIGLQAVLNLSPEETIRLKLDLSKAYSLANMLEETEALLDSILEIPDLSDEDFIQAYSVAAALANKRGKMQRAEQLARKCLEKATDSEDASRLGSILCGLGWALNSQGKFDEGLAHCKRGLQLIEQTGDHKKVLSAFHSLGWGFFNAARLEESRTTFLRMLEHAEAAGLIQEEGRARYALGTIDLGILSPSAALPHYERSEELEIRCQGRGAGLFASFGIAMVLRELGETQQAMERFETIRVAADRVRFPLLKWLSMHQLGVLCMRRGDWKMADGWFKEAVAVAEEYEDLSMLGRTLARLADLSRELHDLGEAESRIDRAMDTLRKSENQIHLMQGLCSLAELRLAQGRPEEALIGFEIIGDVLDRFGVEAKTTVIRLQAKANAALGKHHEAAILFAQCLEQLEGLDYVEELAMARLEVGRWLCTYGQMSEFHTAEWYLIRARKAFQKMEARPRTEESEGLLRYIVETPAAGLSLPMKDAQRLASLYRMVAIVNSAQSSAGLLEKVLELALHAVNAERGMVILVDRDSHKLQVKAKTEVDNGTMDDARRISETIVRDVAKAGEPIFSPDALKDARFSQYESIKINRIACFMCVPLTLRDQIFGTIYVDSQNLDHSFTEDDVAYLRAFAHQAAIAMENIRLREELERENKSLHRQLEGKYSFDTMVGPSPKMQEVCKVVEAVVESPVTVLIKGETGTGKELVARAIHFNGPRSKAAFIPVNCAGLPDSLLESELFGYEKGAFTGALKSSQGVFQAADGGTIFLDEIGDMDLNLQAKLLRVLQTGEVKRLGKAEPSYVDVRVISATNKNLEERMRAGRFREDLYYRLKVVTIAVPTIKERREDIPLLAVHFLEIYNERLSKEIEGFSDDAMSYLCSKEWPGNVRELEHVVEAAVALCRGRMIGIDTLCLACGAPGLTDDGPLAEGGLNLRIALQTLEKEYLTRALEASGWNRTRAAERLGIARQQVHRLMSRHGVEKPDLT